MALEMPLDADSYCTYLGAEEGTMLLLWGYTTGQPLWVILCRLPVKREKRDSRREEREGQRSKRNRNESEKTGNKNLPPLPLHVHVPATRIAGLANCKPVSS